MPDKETLIPKIMQIDGVSSVTPMIEGQVMFVANGLAQGGIVRSFRPDDIKNRKGKMIDGIFVKEGDN